MDKKEISKKYLVSALFLYFGGAAVLFILLFIINRLSHEPVETGLRTALTLLLPLIPLGSYTGFVAFGLKLKEIKTSYAILFIVFYPLVLAFITVSGIILIIPKIISSFINLFRG